MGDSDVVVADKVNNGSYRYQSRINLDFSGEG